MTARIYPTAPGCVEGIISRDPVRIQCQECGRIDSALSLGLKRTTPAAVIQASTIRFHPAGWGDKTDPRLCRVCRLARGCTCHRCTEERRA